MTYLQELYAELARLQNAPANANTQAIQRVNQLITAELQRLGQPRKDLNQINTTFGTPASPPAATDTANANLIALQKRALLQGSTLNEMDFATSVLQSTGNSTLALIYGVASTTNRTVANIYGYIQRPTNLMHTSRVTGSDVTTLITNTNAFLSASIYNFYSSQMVFDPTPPTVYMLVTEQYPPSEV